MTCAFLLPPRNIKAVEDSGTASVIMGWEATPYHIHVTEAIEDYFDVKILILCGLRLDLTPFVPCSLLVLIREPVARRSHIYEFIHEYDFILRHHLS
jgi:hypothetical protein